MDEKLLVSPMSPKNNKKQKRSRRNRRGGGNTIPRIPGVVHDGSRPVYRSHGDSGNKEYKYVDYTQTALIVSDAGATILINGTVEGTDSALQRIGRKIVMKAITIRGVFYNTVANLGGGTFLGNSDLCKFAIVFDKQTNGAAPAFNDVFTLGATLNAPFGNPFISNVDRFIILYEKNMSICSTASTIAHFEVVLKCDLEVRYNANNNGNITDIISGGLFVVYCDTGAGGAPATALNYVTRVVFDDT